MTITPSEKTTTRWTVDLADASAEFAVKTFWGLATVRGRFDRLHGSYEVGPDGPKIELTLDADRLDTGQETRDRHLRSTDFFNVGEHPHVQFISTRVLPAGDGTLYVEGRLEAAGKSVPLELDAEMRQVGSGLEIEVTTTVDHRELGTSSGRHGMIRPPVRLHVKVRLHETPSSLSQAA